MAARSALLAVFAALALAPAARAADFDVGTVEGVHVSIGLSLQHSFDINGEVSTGSVGVQVDLTLTEDCDPPLENPVVIPMGSISVSISELFPGLSAVDCAWNSVKLLYDTATELSSCLNVDQDVENLLNDVSGNKRRIDTYVPRLVDHELVDPEDYAPLRSVAHDVDDENSDGDDDDDDDDDDGEESSEESSNSSCPLRAVSDAMTLHADLSACQDIIETAVRAGFSCAAALKTGETRHFRTLSGNSSFAGRPYQLVHVYQNDMSDVGSRVKHQRTQITALSVVVGLLSALVVALAWRVWSLSRQLKDKKAEGAAAPADYQALELE